jgi:hypothetical protein
MVLAFCCAQNILLQRRMVDYVCAGVFTGLAGATKYNGLLVGMAIVIAHALAEHGAPRRTRVSSVLSGRLFIGIAMIAVGFVLGNPFAVLDHEAFLAGFRFNYLVAPVYEGPVTGHGYWKVFEGILETTGLPSFLLLSVAAGVGMYAMGTVKGLTLEKKGTLLLVGVLAVYCASIGSFPRLPTRFVLPIVPFWLMLAGPLWVRLQVYRGLTVMLMAGLLSYNLTCCYYVGKRFREDPRTAAQVWVANNVQRPSSMEISPYTPRFEKVAAGIQTRAMPMISGRSKRFERQFTEQAWLAERLRMMRQRDDARASWFSRDGLLRRNPEYVAANSFYYSRFEGLRHDYPGVHRFFDELLTEEYGYRIVFDQEGPDAPRWAYPRHIDFLRNRMVLLKRKVSR